MPVKILTSQQRQNYGRFAKELSPEQVAKHCYLTPSEISKVVARRPQPWQQLGYAMQLMTVRFLGTFLEQRQVTKVPKILVTFAAQQLNLREMPDLRRYANTVDIIRSHRQSIREQFGYSDFTESQPAYEAWLRARVLRAEDTLIELFDLSTAWCFERKILLPSPSTMERVIASVHDTTLQGLWSQLADIAQREGCSTRLLGLLEVSPETGRSRLDELQNAPVRQSSTGMQDSEQRIKRFKQIGISELDLSAFPAARLRQMAHYAVLSKHSQMVALHAIRKLATLLAFAHVYEVMAVDDFLDLFDTLMTMLLAKSQRQASQKRLGGLDRLDAAALVLALACEVLVDAEVSDGQIRPTVYARTAQDELIRTIELVRAECRPSKQHHTLEELTTRHRKIAGIIGPLVRSVSLQANTHGQPILRQVAFVKRMLNNPRLNLAGAPLDGLSKTWRAQVLDERGHIRRQGYIAWVAARLREGLRRHDIFVKRSAKWADVKGHLLPDDDTWKLGQKPQICLAFDLPTDGAGLLTRFETELTAAYAEAQRALGQVGVRARFEDDVLVVSPLKAEPIPESRTLLRERTQRMLPVVDLAEVLMEVDQHTQFTQSFVPSSHTLTREPGLNRTICAALLADACNLPYGVVSSPDDPALTEERIAFVHQQFIRADTLSTANRFLVSTQDGIALVRKHWGTGQVASADGLRFRVQVESPHALPNPKYFGLSNGVTYFSFTSDEFTGLHGKVIPGTVRDSLHILETRLHLNTTLQPIEVMTDMASASDAVFALFWFQGYEFRPRYTDLADHRFWRFDADADYGDWNSISRHMLNRERITAGYEEVLRLSASLREGRIQGHAVMQMLGGAGRALTALGRAVVEMGRVLKTKHLLKLATDEYYARRIHTQLNRGEQRNGLARRVFYGRGGSLYRRYVTDQENQLGALGFVLNVIVLWNTLYLDAALDQLRLSDLPVNDADIAHLSPLIYDHIRIEGRYQFNLSADLAHGRLRPLRALRAPSIFSVRQ
jgi:TnpA family transposase